MAIGFPVKDNYVTGEVLTAANMNDLSGTVNTLSGTQIASGKNALINGAFEVWQRGTSSSGNAYIADRWYSALISGTGTFAQETTIVPTGQTNSIKFTASGTAQPALYQAIETTNAIRFAGQTVTVSALVAASTSTGFTIDVQHSASTDNSVTGSWTSITATSGGTATATSTTFVPISGVYAIPSTAKSLRVRIFTTSTIANTVVVYFDNVQLELGSTATSFTRNATTFQGELAACQRYYQLVTRDNYAYVGSAFTTSQAAAPIIFLQPMRVAPAISLAAAGSGTGQMSFLTGAAVIPGTIGTFNATNITYSGFRLDSSGFTSAFTAGQAVFLWAASASVDIWKASAEL